MTINSDVTDYLKSIVPEWTQHEHITGKTLKKVAWSTSKTLNDATLAKNIEAPHFDLILKIETMVRVCCYIDDNARPLLNNKNVQIKPALEYLRIKELKWYKNELKNLGISEKPTKLDYRNQIIELVRLVKKYSKLKSNDINSNDDQKRTAFLRACNEGDLGRMRMLKSLGADTKITDINGNNSLHLAVKCKKKLESQLKKEILYFLLQEGIDLNAKNDKGNTPLISALVNNQSDYAKLLIEKGADVSIINNNKYTRLYMQLASKTIKI